MNAAVPLASSSTSICSCVPPLMEVTVPMSGWSPLTLTDRMSPSGSVSFCVTGSTTFLPGRTPKVSSFAVGGRFSSSRSAATLVIVVVRVSFSLSSVVLVWISWAITQSSTSCMLSMISQDRPNF